MPVRPPNSSNPPIQTPHHPHRRRNPLSDEWVLVSAHRSNRPWQGATQVSVSEQPAGYDADCYLCPGNQRVNGDLNPDYGQTFAFENDYPALTTDITASNTQGALFKSELVTGECRVICYSPDHGKTMAEMSESEIDATIVCWQNEMAMLGDRYTWVQLFENKGESMGCSSPHPHCQVWATSYLPTLVQQEDHEQRQWQSAHNSSLLLETAEREAEDGERVVVETKYWVAVVPYWASWPFETLLLPRFEVQRMADLNPSQREDLARALSELTIRYDNLFQCSFPFHGLAWRALPNV